jgi:hypothetical protein
MYKSFFLKIYGYYLVSSIIFLVFGLYNIGFIAFLSSLIPAIIFIVVFLFYFISGVRLLRFPNSALSLTLVQISLLMQSFQCHILGFLFQNYYGSYFGIGFTDTPRFLLIYQFNIMTFLAGNGYKSDSEIMVVFNLFAIILYIFLNFLSKKNSTSECLVIS